MSRPEHSSPPELFYNDKEAAKYARSTRMYSIQSQITERAIELLNLPEGPKYLLDIGCGTGMSGSVLSEHDHVWVGCDISSSMTDIANENITSESLNGDVLVSDMGNGLGFRGGIFDGAISISAVQWLCYSFSNSKNQTSSSTARTRLKKFFQSLYSSLRRGSRAVIQLYPETPQQMELITNSAMAVGFTGGVVVDYPNSAKAKKFYLVLFAGTPLQSEQRQQLPHGKTGNEGVSSSVDFETERRGFRGKKRGRRDQVDAKSKEWILQKKERQRKQGKQVRHDSKYTGRKRRRKFQ